ncbi:ABC transporter ATP-binding protein [Acidocella sp.]|uniref:ABC transporter ATP-binding protein n=1 Tax=Acidocella sp. TaxID=50710 RepID=UPI003CFFF73A
MSLRIEKLNVRRGGKLVLDDVSLALEPGKTIAVLGPNGAGKSSLVQSIAGMVPGFGGRIMLGGRNLLGSSPEAIRKAGVAAVPEGHQVLARMSVEDNLRAAGWHLDKVALRRGLEDVFTTFPELAQRRAQAAGTMSGGQQQMVALGHALIAKPAFLLIDEMSLGLAPLIVKRLMGVVAMLRESGMGIMLIEQFTQVALALASEVHVLSRGKVQFSGTPAQIKADPEVLHRAYLA